MSDPEPFCAACEGVGTGTPHSLPRASRRSTSDEEEMVDTWLVLLLTLFWCGPIGLGFFLMGLGVFYWGKAQIQKAK